MTVKLYWPDVRYWAFRLISGLFGVVMGADAAIIITGSANVWMIPGAIVGYLVVWWLLVYITNKAVASTHQREVERLWRELRCLTRSYDDGTVLEVGDGDVELRVHRRSMRAVERVRESDIDLPRIDAERGTKTFEFFVLAGWRRVLHFRHTHVMTICEHDEVWLEEPVEPDCTAQQLADSSKLADATGLYQATPEEIRELITEIRQARVVHDA